MSVSVNFFGDALIFLMSNKPLSEGKLKLKQITMKNLFVTNNFEKIQNYLKSIGNLGKLMLVLRLNLAFWKKCPPTQHDLTPITYVLCKIKIALKFMSCINQKLRPSYKTVLNLCLTQIENFGKKFS